jgi:hypothetical protein
MLRAEHEFSAFDLGERRTLAVKSFGMNEASKMEGNDN